jgi:hypothetical protein
MNTNWSILGAGALIAFAIWSQEVNNRQDQACYHLWEKLEHRVLYPLASGNEGANRIVEGLEKVFGITLEQCRKR